MLTTVQRNLAAVKLELLREANGVPQTYVDQLNIAVAHINDAAGIIQTVCAQVEPQVAQMDAERLAERAELEEYRRKAREDHDIQRVQPDVEPAPEPKVSPVDSPLNPDASTDDEIPDMIPVADPESAIAPTRDPVAARAEQARASGRLPDETARQGDPAEEGWG